MTFLVQKTMAILNINSYLIFGLEKKIGFLKNKFRFDFWFRKRIEIWFKTSNLIFVLHKATDLGFNHMHYITTWTKHMHINRHSSYNHSKEKLKQTKERTC